MKFVLLLLFFSVTRLAAQTGNDSVFTESRLVSFSLGDPAVSSPVHLTKASPASPRPRLFIFLSPECPICRNYSPELNRIVSLYRQTTDVYGIVPGRTYSNGAIDSFAHKFNLEFPLLVDKNLSLSHYLRASVTPEVILLDSRNELVYKGAIDDGVVSLGKPGAHTRSHYLADALAAGEKPGSVIPKRTKAVGCILNDY